MLKLVTWVCVVGIAGLLMVGGCTPEANKTWSESTDFSNFQVTNWSGPYSVATNLDDDFTTMNIYQTGSSLQGFDNFRRSWFGSITAGASPQVNLETSDGPRGTEVIVGNAYIMSTLLGDFMAIGGTHWASPRTGVIDMVGLGIPDAP